MAGALFLLSHFPEIQEKIREEITNIVGSRSPTTEDMASMPYTEACMMEILRYQSHLPLTAPHANLSQEVELEGYTIPKGTVVSTQRRFIGRSVDNVKWQQPKLKNLLHTTYTIKLFT